MFKERRPGIGYRMAAPIRESKMASPMFDHGYAQVKMKYVEKVPSFITMASDDHSYFQHGGTPVKCKKRDRSALTPTGKTPKHPEKRVAQGQESKWTDEEIACLSTYMSENPAPSPISNEYWRRCASELNKKLNTTRTGTSCRSFYKRHMESVGTTVLSNISSSDSFTAAQKTENASCQTDLSIPPLLYRSAGTASSQGCEMIADPMELEDEERLVHYLKSAATKKHDIHTTCPGDAELDSQNHLFISIVKLIMSGRCMMDIAKSIMNIKTLKECIWTLFLLEIEEDARYMCEKRRSYLSQGNFDGLRLFQWVGVIQEMSLYQPRLLDVLTTLGTNCNQLSSNDQQHFKALAKEVGMIYGILMKRRNHFLSRIQRVVSMTLSDENVHQKVYDRLQPLGVTVSHSTVLRTQKEVGGHFNLKLKETVRDGNTFRIVGDNINFMIDVSQERKISKRHMEHWFGSVAIVQHGDFPGLSTIPPQLPLLHLNQNYFMPQSKDWDNIIQCYVILVLEVLCKFCAFFKPYHGLVDQLKQEMKPVNYDISMIHKCVPLPVLPKNEQKYSDVIDILDSYEHLVHDIYGDESNVKIHIGGDQLTRERFSGAKRLRSAALSAKERFDHLSAITFEFFHLQMNILTMLFKCLYRKNGTDVGTLNAEKIYLGRSRANGEDVKNHYEDCKELAVSLTDAYVMVAVMHYFAMPSLHASPTSNFPTINESTSYDEKVLALTSSLKAFVEKYIINRSKDCLNSSPDVCQGQFHLTLSDGTKLLITTQQQSKTSTNHSTEIEDGAFSYANVFLELGMLFKALDLSVKIPNRERMLSLLKYVMCVLKGNSNNSKYALEILRFLFHQMSILDEKTAYQTFYGLFVNTKGHMDTNIPADLHMEHHVKVIKSHIKSLHSNKTESALAARSAAIAGMTEIANNYDQSTSVIVRSQAHGKSSSTKDEMSLIERLLRVKPFVHIAGRQLRSYNRPVRSPLKNLDLIHFKGWIRDNQYSALHDKGM